MNKTDIVAALAEKNETTKVAAAEALDSVMEVIAEGLQNDGEVRTELGTFRVVTRPARTARNPKTGEPVAVPEKKAVKFKASGPLRADVN